MNWFYNSTTNNGEGVHRLDIQQDEGVHCLDIDKRCNSSSPWQSQRWRCSSIQQPTTWRSPNRFIYQLPCV